MRLIASWLIVVLMFAVPTFAFAQIPFGGAIVSIVPCPASASLWTIIGPPTPMSLMYTPVSRSFAYGPPVHPGQWLLGLATAPAPCLIPTPVGPIPIGFGFTILFHGSSV